MRAVCVVLGMHRSGTSLLARLVREQGYASPGDLIGGHPDDNPDGYFESRRAVEINNRFLAAVGSHWKDPGALPAGAFDGEPARNTRQEIAGFLALQSCEHLVLKDPRLCRLLPLWRPALEARSDRLVAAMVVRDPDEVYRSLMRRAEHAALRGAAVESLLQSDLLWWRYNLEARLHSSGLGQLTVSYQQMIDHPDRVRARLSALLPPAAKSQAAPDAPLKIRRNRSVCARAIKRSAAWEAFVRSFHLEFLAPSIAGSLCDAQAQASVRVPSGAWKSGYTVKECELFCAGSVKELTARMLLPRRPEASRRRLFAWRRRRGTAGLCFVSPNPATRGHIYRVKNPVDALNRCGTNAFWVTPPQLRKNWEPLRRARGVILHRCIWSDDVEQIVRRCRRERIPLAYDIDDYLFDPKVLDAGYIAFIRELPPSERKWWRKQVEGIRQVAVEADCVITPTAALSNLAVQALNKPVLTIPNGFSRENLALGDYWRRDRSVDPSCIRIGYASGTPTHQADFARVEAQIAQLMLRDERVRLRVVGTLNLDLPEQLRPRIERHPVVWHINLAQELSQFDINVVSLQSNPFCEAKSPLKYFEAALVGVPTVATDNATYREAISHGRDGLLADTQEQWESALQELVDGGAERRTGLANAAYMKVRAVYSVEGLLPLYSGFC